MLTVEAALARILADVRALPAESVPLADAYDRVLAAPVVAPLDLPPWDNSAMDGYAVRSSDLPGRLRVLETIAAGAVGRCRVEPGTASRIMTGAPMPDGADAVVMVEDTRTDGDRVVIERTTRMGQHVRRRGSDVAMGGRVLETGARLSPGAVGLLASLGFSHALVATRPRVAIVSTGDEVVAPGRPLGPGQIYSSNNHALVGLVHQAGGLPIDCGNCPDDRDALRARFTEAAGIADVVVSTGGVSVGDFDYTRDVLSQVEFWRVAMKPGKPLAYGQIAGRPFFGLPGNPVSCVVNFLQFVRPALRMMMGDPRPFLPVVQAELRQPIRRSTGRVELLRVALQRVDGRLFATAAGGHQGSSNVLGVAHAHGLALLDAEAAEVDGTVRVQIIDPSFDDGADPGYGWGALPSRDGPCCP
ncbi:MAG: molybdopterin molybdenumtransferase MoeA [Myxococcales bacterium]|nr:molybdopterin molybdenumtransferase MoeA [Myxococcales bacterium]